MKNWAGKRLGKVLIESLLGRGGVAEVYLGTHTTLDRKVAVKILRNLDEDNADALARFEREARAVAKLRHPNIVQVHDFDTVEDDPYLVMEYIEGPSLSNYLKTLHKNNQRLDFPQAIRLLNGVASALQYAHKNGVIHRDIKPGNILLTSASSQIMVGEPLPDDFEPVLTDFGLVRFLDAHRQTTTGHIAGTPAYMSPEQARGEATDARTDIYSLGIVLYEILAGHVPFDGETTVSILLKQVNEPPAPIPGLPPMIQSVVGRSLAKDPRDRFQTPMEFANAFRVAVETGLNASTVEVGSLEFEGDLLKTELPTRETSESAGKSPRRWLAGALLGGVAIALVGFIFMSRRPASAVASPTPSVPSATYTIPPATQTSTSTPPPPLPQGPDRILRFQDGTAVADRAFLIVRAMPAPLAGSQYEIWLTDGRNHTSLGVFSPDETGKAEVNFSEPEGLNLLARYNTVEITIEPKPDADPAASGLLAYSFTLPPDALTHIRYLLSSFPGAPNKSALIQGLSLNIKQIHELAKDMQRAFESDDASSVQKMAEEALNLLVGAKSPDFKDWNRDGQTIAKTTSYGLLVNGSNFGYIQAVYAEADFTVNTAGATQYMIESGEVVKTCTQNLVQWAPGLRELLLTILTSTSETEISGSIDDLVNLTDQMLNGIDLDNDGTIDTVAGECGTGSVYEYAYYMADMPILPVSISYQLTVVANPAYVTPTRRSQNSGNSQNNQPANNSKPKPTKKPKPSDQPREERPRGNPHQ